MKNPTNQNKINQEPTIIHQNYRDLDKPNEKDESEKNQI